MFADEAADGLQLMHMNWGYMSNGISFETMLFGGSGNDVFSFYSNSVPLFAYGEAGDDSFVLHAFKLYSENDKKEYLVHSGITVNGGSGNNQIVSVDTNSKTDLSSSGFDIKTENIQKSNDNKTPVTQAFALEGQQELIKIPVTTNMLMIILIILGTCLLVMSALVFIYIRRRKKPRSQL